MVVSILTNGKCTRTLCKGVVEAETYLMGHAFQCSGTSCHEAVTIIIIIYSYQSINLSLSDPLGHLLHRMDFLYTRVYNLGNKLESSLTTQLRSTLDEILPRLIADSLEETLHDMLSDPRVKSFISY
ncbi:hypothetical protein Tco_0846321 [Tanacetum coccineum]